jgi:ABC-type dipeptide/oligopeptide/nickel transport system permease component
MAEAVASSFAQNARALGIPCRRMLFRHLLPAALNPLISLAGLSFGTLFSASFLIEVIVGWPGLGPLFLDAIVARDFTVVIAVVMLASTFLVTGNLAADFVLYRTDPRIREIP